MKRDKFLIISFVIIISSFLLFMPYAIVKNIASNSRELGNIIKPKIYSSDEMFSSYQNLVENYKAKIEDIILYRFPGYNQILEKNTILDKKMNYALYNILGSEYNSIPLTKKVNLYYYDNIHSERLIKLYAFNDNISKNQFINSANFYNQYSKKLKDKFPDVNLYLYYIPSVWNSQNETDNKLYPYDECKYINGFLSTLDKDIAMSYLQIEDFNSYEEHFYKTDHHWNIFGGYEGYKDIIELINQKTDIGSPREIKKIFKIDGLEFRGSMSRVTMLDEYYDELWDIELMDMSDYTVMVDDKVPSEHFSLKEKYLNDDIPDKSIYANHYGTYWHADYAKIEFNFENNTGRNILIFGDSTDNCIDTFIASHFDKTIFLDFRLYKEHYGTDIDKLIEENNITDIMFFSGYSTFVWDNPANTFMLR